MMEPDSFLLTHLPILPMWQLSEDYVSFYDFSKGKDSLRIRLAQELGNDLNCQNEIDKYQDTGFLVQLFELGEERHEYTPHNPAIKALKYYNFMSLIHNKDIQKLARGSVYEINSSKRDVLYALNDTIVKYNKLFKKAEKGIFKITKAIDKDRYKLTVGKSKENLKLIKKINFGLRNYQ